MSFFRDDEKQFILPYETCKNIYRTATLGKRIVEGLVNFAMSAEREIDIHKAPPEAIEKFNKTAEEMKQKEAIKQTIYNSRIYGTGALYVAMFDEEKEENDFTTKPTFEDAYKYKMKFTVLDPLNISGSRVDLDPLSFHFLEVVDVKVGSIPVPKKRIAVSHALEPLYLDTRTSLIPFSPPSVFYNMVELLQQYDNAIKSIGDLLYKAGAIIHKYPAKAKLNGISIDAITASKKILEQKRSGEVISISADSSIEDFPISNLTGLIDSINKLEDDITKALNDTPASILFDKSLSNGFSEGDKDKETEISIIESFRENKLTPLYTLTDYYIMLKAWDNVFIDEMRHKYAEYENKTDKEIFRSWAENFTYKYGNLFPEPESITQDNNAKKLDNLLKAQQLGANSADLQEELNESEIFKNEIELDSQPQNMEEMEEEDINFNKPPSISGIKADADAYSGQSPSFKEEEHPRNPDGTFAKGTQSEKGSGENKSKEDIEKAVKSLPEHLKEAGKRLYNSDQIQSEYTVKKLSKVENEIYYYTNRNGNLKSSDDFNKLFENSPKLNYTIYRGCSGSALNNTKLDVGKYITFDNPKGFSKALDVAKIFLNRSINKYDKAVLYQIEGEHKELNIEGYSRYDEKERLVKGKFKILEIENKKDYKLIKLKQEGI